MPSSRCVAARAEQRGIDRYLVDLGMAAVPVLHLQPLTQVHADAGIDEALAAIVEPRLVPQRLAQDLESLAEGVVAEVVEPRSFDGGSHQLAR